MDGRSNVHVLAADITIMLQTQALYRIHWIVVNKKARVYKTAATIATAREGL